MHELWALCSHCGVWFASRDDATPFACPDCGETSEVVHLLRVA